MFPLPKRRFYYNNVHQDRGKACLNLQNLTKFPHTIYTKSRIEEKKEKRAKKRLTTKAGCGILNKLSRGRPGGGGPKGHTKGTGQVKPLRETLGWRRLADCWLETAGGGLKKSFKKLLKKGLTKPRTCGRISKLQTRRTEKPGRAGPDSRGSGRELEN